MRSIVGLFILSYLVAGAPAPLHSDEHQQLADFSQAYAHYTRGQHGPARELFKRTLSTKFVLTDYSLYYLASIALASNAWDEARRLAARLKSEFPHSVWLHAAELQMAKADLGQNRLAEAATALRALRAKKIASGDIIEEALYLQAQTAGDPARAYELYQQLREQFPNSKWTPAARREQAALKASHPTRVPFDTAASLIAEADQLVRERAHGEAEVILKKLLHNADEPDLRRQLLTRLSSLYLTMRRRNDAMPILQQIVEDYPETPDAAKALYQIGQIQWNRHDNTQALATFNQLMAGYPGSSDLDRAYFAAADIQEWLGNRDEAIALYSKVRLEFPYSQVHDDATWRLAWLYYRNREAGAAYRTFKLLASEARDSGLRIAARYWQGRSAENAGDYELAKQVYSELYTDSAESYYQALAAGALARLGAPVNEALSPPPARTSAAEIPAVPGAAFHLARAKALSRLELYSLAVAEIGAIERIAGTDVRTRLFLSREYFNNRAYRRSLAVATQLPASEEERNLYRFPLAHWETIQRKAQDLAVDPYLVLGLIRQESLFDTSARSPAFALGLMQLLPSTANRVAKRLGMPALSNDKLFDPEINLTLGTQYLKDLLQRYSGNWFKAIAAYNAGEAAVDRWEREIATDDNEEFVERIPYSETRGYVKLVLRNHRIYKRLYETKR
jgi:soluble lytic murein transglycosylase